MENNPWLCEWMGSIGKIQYHNAYWVLGIPTHYINDTFEVWYCVQFQSIKAWTLALTSHQKWKAKRLHAIIAKWIHMQKVVQRLLPVGFLIMKIYNQSPPYVRFKCLTFKFFILLWYDRLTTGIVNVKMLKAYTLNAASHCYIIRPTNHFPTFICAS